MDTLAASPSIGEHAHNHAGKLRAGRAASPLSQFSDKVGDKRLQRLSCQLCSRARI